MKNFALIGAAGYIAPKHFEAIKSVGGNLLAILDPFDSVGIIDRYFPKSEYFKEAERFDRHLYKLKKKNPDKSVNYISICTPNYLHDSHIRLALRNDAHAICEKPIVANPWNVEGITDVMKDTGKNVYGILQLRLHPSIIELKDRLNGMISQKHNIELIYITPRGKWYDYSWKGDISKSGGVATNIGVHFFDLLIYLFGKVKTNLVWTHQIHKASGYLELENANVKWLLSIDNEDLPNRAKAQGMKSYRRLIIDDTEFDLDNGFTDLHIKSYEEILKGNGFPITEAATAIQTVYEIRKKLDKDSTRLNIEEFKHYNY